MSDSNRDPGADFLQQRSERVSSYAHDRAWQQVSSEWRRLSFERQYMYNFSWLGRPIIQSPADMVALQELVWRVKPDLIVETGIAHGGSLLMSATLLAVLDLCDVRAGVQRGARKVIGIDIDIRSHNRKAIESHPMSSAIKMIEGSSIDEGVIDEVKQIAEGFERVMVILDSNHTHQHVLAELDAYAPLVSKGSYCVVFDTVVEVLPPDTFINRPWGHGNNPMTACREWLKSHPEFEIDALLHEKLMVSAAPSGFLQRVE